MAIMPTAVQRLLQPENRTEPAITATQLIYHTAVDAKGPTNLPGYFDREDIGLESHFWVPNDGTIVQMMDTGRQADANYTANVRAISVETEDDGDPEGNPWTTAQLAALVDIAVWCHRTHGIPIRRCPAHNQPGVGWHSMWSYPDPINLTGRPIPSPWTPALGKTCPGRTRIRQLIGHVIPTAAARVNAGGGPSVPATINEQTIRQFQTAVRAMGGDPGPIDGKKGPKTRAGAHWVYDELGGEPHRPNADYQKLIAELTAARSEEGAWQRRALEAESKLAEWATAIGGADPAELGNSHRDLETVRRILSP